MIILGDFNVKATTLYSYDTTSYEGFNTVAIASQFGLQQIIKEATHLTGNISSCID